MAESSACNPPSSAPDSGTMQHAAEAQRTPRPQPHRPPPCLSFEGILSGPSNRVGSSWPPCVAFIRTKRLFHGRAGSEKLRATWKLPERISKATFVSGHDFSRAEKAGKRRGL